MIKFAAIFILPLAMVGLKGLTLEKGPIAQRSLPSAAFSARVESEDTKKNADTTLLKVGDECPDILFNDTSGRDVSLKDLKGKYVLIDVWASWCAPCRIQQPFFSALEESMKDKQITFLCISIDTRVFRWKGPVLNNMGGKQWIVKDMMFEKAFGINMIPRYILLDKKGRVMKMTMPLPSSPELEQELKRLDHI